jgi:hypothetical protein
LFPPAADAAWHEASRPPTRGAPSGDDNRAMAIFTRTPAPPARADLDSALSAVRLPRGLAGARRATADMLRGDEQVTYACRGMDGEERDRLVTVTTRRLLIIGPVAKKELEFASIERADIVRVGRAGGGGHLEPAVAQVMIGTPHREIVVTVGFSAAPRLVAALTG